MENEIQKPPQDNSKKVAWLGLSFTLLFTGYIAAQNTATTVYNGLGFEGLGEKCVLVIYLFQALGSIVASYFKQFLSHRSCFILGAMGYASLVIAGLVTSTCSKDAQTGYCSATGVLSINIVASVFCGMGASIIWLNQSDYVNTASTDETKGTYNSIFWGLMQLCQLTSSSLATFVLQAGHETTFYIAATIPVTLSLIMFAFTPKLEVPQKEIEERESLGSILGKFGKATVGKKSFFLFPGMFLIGVAIGFYATNLSSVNKAVADHDGKIATNTVGLIFIILGIGEIAAGAIVGKLADKFNKIKVLHAMIVIPEVGLILTALAYHFLSYPLLVGSGFAWGFTDTALNSIVGTVIGACFGGALEYFAVMRFWTGIGAAAGSLLSMMVPQAWTCLIVTAVVILVLHVVFLLTKDDKLDAKKTEGAEAYSAFTDA